MTNKTINGVPRAVLSDVFDELPDWSTPAATKLSALLAAPDPAKCQNCGLSTAEQCDDIGCGFLCAGNGAPDPIVDADGIGKPVAWRTGEVVWPYKADAARHADRCNLFIEPLYSADQLAALQSTIAQLNTENERLRGGLGFYAERDHYSIDDGLNWDSCSGEPVNILWHEEQPWFIEDGTVARTCLNEVRRKNT